MSEHYTVTNVSDEFTEIKLDISFEIFNTVKTQSIKNKIKMFCRPGKIKALTWVGSAGKKVHMRMFL